MSETSTTSQLLQDFVDGLISASVQYFDVGDDDSGLTTQIQFSLGIDQPTVFIEVLTTVAEDLVAASPKDRDEVFVYIMNRFSGAGL